MTVQAFGYVLRQWGRFRRDPDSLGFPGESALWCAVYFTRGCGYVSSLERHAVLELDDLIQALPAELGDVLAAEYAQGGSMRARLDAAGLPLRTYGRQLKTAHKALMARLAAEGFTPARQV
jgi:hypothetical protein